MTLRTHTLVAALPLLIIACEKSKAPAPAPTPVAAAKAANSGKAEVEFFGKWSAGEVKAAKVIFVAQVEPCAPVPAAPTRFGEVTLGGESLFAEFFIPQGAKGSACVYGLAEDGHVVGLADSTQNPMTFEGTGEVIFGKLDFTLRAP